MVVMGPRILIVVGSAPTALDDIHALPEAGGMRDYMIVGKHAARLPIPWRVEYLATYHPEDIEAARAFRFKAMGNIDYKVICHKKEPGVDIVVPYEPPSGSSSFLAALGGKLLGYQKIILCGCPLAVVPGQARNENYAVFREGWEVHSGKLEGKARSMSGWTRDHLGAPTNDWMTEGI